ncbi:hypothetical protein AAC387_Pa04g0583 [Persea americana]
MVMGIQRRRSWRFLLLCLPLLVFLPLLFSELHRNSKEFDQDLGRKHPKKFDHIVLGPAAGEGLPNRLQCSGLKALNKTHASRLSHAFNCSEIISFVTVFAVYNSSPSDEKLSDLVTVGNNSYSKAARSMAILNTYINFIQVSMPKSNVIVLSNPASELLIRRNNVSLLHIQGDYSRGKLMLQRIKSYIAFLETKYEEHLQGKNHLNHYIFTDSDMAVVDGLCDMFHKYPDFHLALTFRNNKDQPLNSGFIAVRGTPDGLQKAKIFLQEVLEAYSSKYAKASRMLGDQLALYWIIKSHPSFDVKRFSRPAAFVNEIHGAQVLFLPCAIYNWTPPEGAGQFHGMPLDVKVVHFKGSRKRLMLESWNFFSSSGSDISDMLCLILRSGRTKYDF